MAEIKLGVILWAQNNPYGSFNAGDNVAVYWDDSTSLLVVRKNGSIITSGNQIPFKFTYSGNNENYYKYEQLFQVLICKDFSLVSYERIASFPYFAYTLQANHPSCNLGQVCDLEFNAIASVTNASTSSSNDGVIVVSATSSAASIQYNLNSDFVYGKGQSSSTFSNLAPGVYTIYARDSNNCRSVINAKVEFDKTYGTKYRLEYQSADGRTHKTEITEKDYSGTISDVNAGVSPTIYRLRNEGNQEKFIEIVPSEIETTFISESENQFIDIYTNDPDKYRLTHTINGDVVWTGKVLINQYQETYTNAPYSINIIAADGLVSLESIPFLDSNGLPFFGVFRQMNLISYILKKIGTNLGIRSAVNMYASTMLSLASSDPLDQAYVDVERYYLLEPNPTCSQILKWILQPYNATILQWDNYWYIIRFEERIDSFDYREFDADGVYVSNSSINPIIDLKNATEASRMVWKDRNQIMRIMPGYGKIKLIYDLGNNNNIIPNGNFRLTTKYRYDLPIDDNFVERVPDLTGFQIFNVQVGSSTQVGYEKLENNNIALTVSSYIGKGLNYMESQPLNLKMVVIDKLKINLNTKIFRGDFVINAAFGLGFYYIKVKMMVKYGDYYLLEDGTWTTTPSLIKFYVNENQLNQYNNYELLADSPDTTYKDGADLVIRVYFPDLNDTDNYGNTTTVAFLNLRGVQTTNKQTGFKTELDDIDGTYYPPSAAAIRSILYYELQEDGNTESLPDIVRPNDYDATTNRKQWILKNYRTYSTEVTTTTGIDFISAQILSQGKPVPDNQALELSMENNNTVFIDRTIIHGSIVNAGKTLINAVKKFNPWAIEIFFNTNEYKISSAEWYDISPFVAVAADLIYKGYLRDSGGAGFEYWSRTGFNQYKSLQEIYMDSYSSQYNQPWRWLSGDMYSDDTLFTPISTLNETMDGNRKYIPSSLSIDFYSNIYNAELIEVFDIATNSPAGFTTGFTTGFNA